MTSIWIATAALAGLLITASAIDLRTRRIPDPLNAAIAAAGVGVVWMLQTDWLTAMLGAFLGYGIVWVANAAYRWRRGRDGIGMGDAKLLGACGVWIGWTGLPYALLIASGSALALVAAISVMRRRLDGGMALPFGPFLATGVFLDWIASRMSQF